MRHIEEASDRALKGIETILPLVVEKFLIAVGICYASFDLILQAWCAMNRTRKGNSGALRTVCTLSYAMNRTHKKWYAKTNICFSCWVQNGVHQLLSEMVHSELS